MQSNSAAPRDHNHLFEALTLSTGKKRSVSFSYEGALHLFKRIQEKLLSVPLVLEVTWLDERWGVPGYWDEFGRAGQSQSRHHGLSLSSPEGLKAVRAANKNDYPLLYTTYSFWTDTK